MDYRTIWISIVCSIASVLIVGLVLKFRLFLKLYRLNGSYTGYNHDQSIHRDRIYYVNFSIWNIIRFTNQLKITQESSEKSGGDWISKILISSSNLSNAIGTFKYITKYPGEWGTHIISINLEDKIIHIEAESKRTPGIDKYYICKNNCT